jgi:hypothetical protein
MRHHVPAGSLLYKFHLKLFNPICNPWIGFFIHLLFFFSPFFNNFLLNFLLHFNDLYNFCLFNTLPEKYWQGNVCREGRANNVSNVDCNKLSPVHVDFSGQTHQTDC